MCYGATKEEAIVNVEALALRVFGDQLSTAKLQLMKVQTPKKQLCVNPNRSG